MLYSDRTVIIQQRDNLLVDDLWITFQNTPSQYQHVMNIITHYHNNLQSTRVRTRHYISSWHFVAYCPNCMFSNHTQRYMPFFRQGRDPGVEIITVSHQTFEEWLPCLSNHSMTSKMGQRYKQVYKTRFILVTYVYLIKIMLGCEKTLNGATQGGIFLSYKCRNVAS